MIFEPLASSSSGNAYRITAGGSSLLLEAGIPYKQLQQALNFQVTKLDAAIITHEHKDHAQAVKDLLRAGVDVYMTEGTRQAIGLQHHRIKTVKAQQQLKIGAFTILPFETEHDAAEPVGFLIQDQQDRLLFATDTYYLRYRFPGLTIIAVECNYSAEILDEQIAAGNTPEALRPRLERSHFSLANYKTFLEANDLNGVREIWLIHMSSTNADPELFKREVQAATGKPVYIAGR